MIDTPARAALRRWMDEDAERTPTFVVRALGLRQTSSLQKWLLGVARPESHMREAIELITRGRVRAAMWLLPEERAFLRTLRTLATQLGPPRRKVTVKMRTRVRARAA